MRVETLQLAVLQVPGELQGLRGQERPLPLHLGPCQELPCSDLIGGCFELGRDYILQLYLVLGPLVGPPVLWPSGFDAHH